MWLPVITGGSALLRPARRMKPLPILSIVTVIPASRAQPVTRSRPCLSRSVSVRRQTPPLGVAPIFASSMSEAQRRSPSMRSSLTPSPRGLAFMSIRVSSSGAGQGQHGVGALDRRRRLLLDAPGGGVEVRAERRPLDVAARTRHGAQVAVDEHELALAQGVGRVAAHGAALEDVEVALRELRLRRNRLRRLRIPQDEVGVGAFDDAALLRIEVEEL